MNNLIKLFIVVVNFMCFGFNFSHASGAVNHCPNILSRAGRQGVIETPLTSQFQSVTLRCSYSLGYERVNRDVVFSQKRGRNGEIRYKIEGLGLTLSDKIFAAARNGGLATERPIYNMHHAFFTLNYNDDYDDSDSPDWEELIFNHIASARQSKVTTCNSSISEHEGEYPGRGFTFTWKESTLNIEIEDESGIVNQLSIKRIDDTMYGNWLQIRFKNNNFYGLSEYGTCDVPRY